MLQHRHHPTPPLDVCDQAKAPHTQQRGFTLIELVIAMALMSLLALMGWQGIDRLLRTRDITQQHTQQSTRMAIALAQWRADLEAQQIVPHLNDSGVAWDGRVLRLIRRSSALQADGNESGLWVVAWVVSTDSQNKSHWMRWQSEALTQTSALQQAWNQAQQWGQNQTNDPAHQTSLIAVNQWQLYFYRGNAWTNALSSADQPTTASPLQANSSAPDAIRIQLDVAPDNGVSGPITLDWVKPHFSNAKS